ncbi:hypothetical protein LCGC14_2342120 [marine sediment metagenome]|uniref:Transcription regulator PadR N-terminal domain-containing protein n=1 Tax=marine sediment metagenome TaxID=412755 RepID=A0A0F9CZB7_9ZZZZ
MYGLNLKFLMVIKIRISTFQKKILLTMIRQPQTIYRITKIINPDAIYGKGYVETAFYTSCLRSLRNLEHKGLIKETQKGRWEKKRYNSRIAFCLTDLGKDYANKIINSIFEEFREVLRYFDILKYTFPHLKGLKLLKTE